MLGRDDTLFQLVRVLQSEVTPWLVAHLEDFDFCPPAKLTSETAQTTLKPFCELCFLSDFVNPNSSFFTDVQTCIAKKLFCYDWDALVKRNTDLFIALISVDRFARTYYNKSIFAAYQPKESLLIYNKVPYRMLEILTHFALVEHMQINKLLEIRRYTVLGIRQNINTLSYPDLYSVTHELMYIWMLLCKNIYTLEDFELDLTQVKNYLLELLAYITADGNLDLIAELVLCLGLLPFDFTIEDMELIEFALREMTLQVNKDGSLRAHTKYDKTTIGNFNDVYHTTSIVKGMSDIWQAKLSTLVA